MPTVMEAIGIEEEDIEKTSNYVKAIMNLFIEGNFTRYSDIYKEIRKIMMGEDDEYQVKVLFVVCVLLFAKTLEVMEEMRELEKVRDFLTSIIPPLRSVWKKEGEGSGAPYQ